MITFLWKHKFLSLMIICFVVYFFVNQPRKFGLAAHNFVVYNRVPIAFLDLFVGFDGSIQPMSAIAGADEQKDWVRDILDTPRQDSLLLVVGTGFVNDSFRLSDSLKALLEEQGIRTSQFPSPEAIRQFNAAPDRDQPVAILLSVRR